MVYLPWMTYEEQDAGYFAVFILGYPFADALRFVRQASASMRDFMADQGRWHRSACQRGLAALVNQMLTDDAKQKRMLPVVVTPNVELTGAAPVGEASSPTGRG